MVSMVSSRLLKAMASDAGLAYGDGYVYGVASQDDGRGVTPGGVCSVSGGGVLFILWSEHVDQQQNQKDAQCYEDAGR